MQTSIFLAKLIGPLLLVMGAGILIKPADFRTMVQGFIGNTALIYLAGVLAFVPGLAVVLTHNVWTADWRIAITLLGWLALIAGIIRILLPQQVQAAGAVLIARPATLAAAGIAFAAIGALLCFFGYFR